MKTKKMSVTYYNSFLFDFMAEREKGGGGYLII